MSDIAAQLSQSSGDLAVQKVSKDFAFGVQGPVFIAIWRGEQTLESHQLMEDGLRKAVERAPGATSFICIIEPSAPIPKDPRIRSESSGMLARMGSRLCSAAAVIEGTGLRITTIRSILIGVNMVVQRSQPQPIKVTGTVSEAMSWISGFHPTFPSLPTEVTRAVRQLRKQLDLARR